MAGPLSGTIGGSGGSVLGPDRESGPGSEFGPGSELGSGSVRIHDPGIQRRVFSVLGIGDAEAESRFGWFLRALKYGTPPHAGFAVGVDRLFSILQNEPNIREIIPFPKTQTGVDPLTESPTTVAASIPTRSAPRPCASRSRARPCGTRC